MQDGAGQHVERRHFPRFQEGRRPGLWISTSVAYGRGGESTVNGIRSNDRIGGGTWRGV